MLTAADTIYFGQGYFYPPFYGTLLGHVRKFLATQNQNVPQKTFPLQVKDEKEDFFEKMEESLIQNYRLMDVDVMLFFVP